MITPQSITSIALPQLNAGEINAGMLFVNDTPAHWVIVLPTQAKALNWPDAGAWAKEQGGELPTRKEGALVFANAGHHMQTDDAYWTSEPYAGHDAFAWCQWFDHGRQRSYLKSGKGRAFAVRRVTI